MKINVEFIYPPIPDRRFDYQATEDNYDIGSPIGYGPTRAEAVAALLEQIGADEGCPATDGEDHEFVSGVDIGGERDERFDVVRCVKCGEDYSGS